MHLHTEGGGRHNRHTIIYNTHTNKHTRHDTETAEQGGFLVTIHNNK